MTAPRVKRPFSGADSDPAQRRITNFFPRGENSFTIDRPSIAHETSAPQLPPTVQANLLAVGMRVRKSVPEGYKTGKEDDDPWTTASNGFSRSQRTASSSWLSYSTPAQATLNGSAAPSPVGRELVPFCGIHKVGGLGVQSYGDDADRPRFATSLFGGMDSTYTLDDDASEPPSLTSSQETVSSMSSISSSRSDAFVPSWHRNSQQTYRLSPPRWVTTKSSMRKRVYGVHEDDADDDENDNVHDDGEAPYRGPADGVFSSASSSINGWLASSTPGLQTAMVPLPQSQHYFQNGRRVLAMPRRRQQQQLQQQKQQQGPSPRGKPSMLALDQENTDFDEADFLDTAVLGNRRSNADLEMGGM